MDLLQLTSISPSETEGGLRVSAIEVLDLRPAMTYRKGHIPGALWGIRPRLAALPLDRTKCVVLVADEAATAALAAIDLAEVEFGDVRLLAGGYAVWCGAGLPVEASPDRQPGADCIDFLFFVHDRHDGNAEAAPLVSLPHRSRVHSAARFNAHNRTGLSRYCRTRALHV